MTPWNFAQLPGLEEEKALLRQLSSGARIPHALLFLGDYGSGTLGLALAFARLVLCESSGTEEPCEQCSGCRKTAGWVHPDLHFSFPVVGTRQTSRMHLASWRSTISADPYFTPAAWFEIQGGEDKKQGNINVDECHEIIEKLNVTVVEGAYKILILWGAEFLGTEGNRLLKLIEEPPDRSLFLIIGADTTRILPTVLSRCQLIKVRPFRDEEVAEALIAHSLAGEVEAIQMAFLADGNIHEAFRLAGSGEWEIAAQFLQWMRSCYRKVGIDTLRLAETLAAYNREDQKTFLIYALHFVRQMVRAHSGMTDKIRLSGADLQAARDMAALFDLDRLEELAEMFRQALFSVERNAQSRLLFVHLSVQMHALFHVRIRYLNTQNVFS